MADLAERDQSNRVSVIGERVPASCPRADGATNLRAGEGGKRRGLACYTFHKRVFFQAVARNPKDPRKGGESPLNQGSFASGPAAQFMGLGLQFVLSLLLFLYLGQWADGKLGTSPLFMIIGVFTGASAAFYSMYRRLKAAERKEEAQDLLDKEKK